MVEENSQASGVFSSLRYSKFGAKVKDTVQSLPENDPASMKKCDGSYIPLLQVRAPTFNGNQQTYNSFDGNLECTGPCLLHEEVSQEILTEYTLADIAYVDLAGVKNDSFPETKSDTLSSVLEPYPETNSPLSFWSNCPLDLETMKMDDVFQVDKDDLVQSPTLAELNANDESLFDSFDNFDTLLPTEQKSQKIKCVPLASDEQYDGSVFDLVSVCNSSTLRISSDMKDKFPNVPGNSSLSCSKELKTTEVDIKLKYQSSLHEVKLQTVPTLAQTYEIPLTTHMNDLYSVPEHSKVNNIETNSIESECIMPLNKEHEQLQQILGQDDLESEEESEIDCDYSTEAESEDEKRDDNPDEVLLEKKKKRFFWQYNVQSKGPKTMKLSISGKCGASDPVFNSTCSDKSVKHAGKARRGDGNDLTPNPKKLYHIGLELRKLNSVIDELVPANELPLNARINSRKEKNKLASRACRLKKKAQHEANKLKLFGLQQERKHLLPVITEAKKLIKKRIVNGEVQNHSLLLGDVIETLITSRDIPKVAGCSADFVNNALKKVGAGDDTGGLNINESN